METSTSAAEDLAKKIEALLFSSGKRMSIAEISRLCRSTPEAVVAELQKLKAAYEQTNSSLMIIDEGDSWKITVREKYLPLVQKIVAETELTRTVMETLAVVAWKAPVLQSDVIRVRTNKAYEHLKELEETGFISRAKHGRTQLIKLTDKFFNYFDLQNKEDIEKKFGKFKEAQTAVEKFDQPAVETPAEAAEEKKEPEQLREPSNTGENSSS
ncbi:MAG: SMC-Scp complex subunit ScpB [Candidatus Woesearchaeota archaeon]